MTSVPVFDGSVHVVEPAAMIASSALDADGSFETTAGLAAAARPGARLFVQAITWSLADPMPVFSHGLELAYGGDGSTREVPAVGTDGEIDTYPTASSRDRDGDGSQHGDGSTREVPTVGTGGEIDTYPTASSRLPRDGDGSQRGDGSTREVPTVGTGGEIDTYPTASSRDQRDGSSADGQAR